MEITTILTLENNTASGIILHQEGIFWKAYEQSAWRFVKHVRPYLLTKRYVKVAKQEVVSLGFPASALDRVLGNRPYTQTDPKRLLVECEDTAQPGEFERWKQSVPLQTVEKASAAPPQPAGNELHTRIVGELAAFDLAHASPLDCMQFIARLKQELTSNY